ncbi:chromatin associated protein KTI12 [Aspergillus varians]
MPLIILTGYPCSGLTHRANQLATRLEETQSELFSSETLPTPKSKYKIHIVSTHDNVNHPRTVYDTARTEKEARGIAYTRAKRMLGRDSFVILDGMNYIKGYRYQLWCEAKSLGTSCCVVHVGTPADQCIANNEVRIQRKNASPESNETPSTPAEPNPESESRDTNTHPEDSKDSKDGESSDPYPPDLLKNLIFRYEEPSMHSRWDKPLFTVPWSDAEPPIAEIWTALTGTPHPSTISTTTNTEEADTLSQLTASLASTTLSSAASTTTTAAGGQRSTLSTRPRVTIKPHQATVLPATSDSSALYNMEKRTSGIIQAIRSFTQSNPSAKAALAICKQEQENARKCVDIDAVARQEEGIRIPVPDSSTPIFIPAHIILASVTDDLAAAGGLLALPRMQRLRRQWITLNRAYVAVPHAAGKGGGGLKEGEVGEAFVRFLNADFADEVEG